MSRTALQIVNDVLVRLRQSEVTDFSDSYTKLILAYVNETMQEVQDYHQWEVLKAEVQFDTVAAQSQYLISDTTDGVGDVISGGNVVNTRSTLCHWQHPQFGRQPLAFDTQDFSATSGSYQLFWRGQSDGYAMRYRAAGLPTNVALRFYSYVDYQSDNHYVYFVDEPSAARRIRMIWYVPQANVTTTTDTIYAPDRPIVLGAYAKALSERGEELGPQGQEAYLSYIKARDAAVQHDVGDQEEIAVPE